jgi:hypothetical protein
MTIQEVAQVLVSMGFIGPEAAARLFKARTIITPQPGINTVRLEDFISLDRGRLSRRANLQASKPGRPIYSSLKAKPQQKPRLRPFLSCASMDPAMKDVQKKRPS